MIKIEKVFSIRKWETVQDSLAKNNGYGNFDGGL